jgi:hydrogenase maturation protease
VVIGVGNPYRGDDAAGLLAARHAAALLPADVTVVEEEGEPTALLDRWRTADAAVVIDAVVSGARPGTVHRIDAAAGPVPSSLFGVSTHALSVADAIELARALKTLPPRIIVYGIEGENFEAGTVISPQVAAAVEDTARRVAAEAMGLRAEG